MKHHKLVHLNERNFACDVCGKKFGERGNLNKHIKGVHEEKRDYECNVCGRKFAFKDGLNRHMKTHSARPGSGAGSSSSHALGPSSSSSRPPTSSSSRPAPPPSSRPPPPGRSIGSGISSSRHGISGGSSARSRY